MAIHDATESTSSVVSELKKSSDGTNLIKEYKDIFSKEKSSGSDLKTDKIADEAAALSLLKVFIEEKKKSIADEKKKKKWDFPSSPHAHFGKTLDDTYMAFLCWARVKEDKSSVNVSKALRRLESYADWLHDTGTDLTEPALTSESVKKALEAWVFDTTLDSQGRLVWWCDMGRINIKQVKADFTPEDHLRAFVWYIHALMYNDSAQKNGMVFVQNINKIGMVQCFTLMPAKIATKLDRLTIGVLPIKMQCMYMFESPTWINVFMKVIGMFMSKKMKSRMIILKDWNEIDKIGGLEAIPKGFGKVNGTMDGSIIEKKYFAEEI
mmetsp:Transcript_11903/g.25783  ORF Transcript_11903/g.25783 Transcript_11903/m.25783 type:complete len:323 (+) Transcript_11903:133-1101(+)